MSPTHQKRTPDALKLGYGSLLAISLAALVLGAGIIGLSRAGASGGSTFVTLPTTTPPPTTASSPAPPSASATSTPTSTPTTSPPSGDPKAMGLPNAPVTIVEYEDFK